MRTLTLYVARDCSLCESAREVLERLQADTPFELEVVDITGISELERRYRQWLPVGEVDGERAFVYRVEEAALRARLEEVPPPPLSGS